MTKTAGKKKRCRCNIRGCVWLGRTRKDLGSGTIVLIRPELHVKYWRNFKYCPICGKEL